MSIAKILLLLACLSAASASAAGAGSPSDAGRLVDQRGETFDDAALRGGFHLLYFGYRNCPDICPTSLFEMTAAIDLLPERDRTRLTPVFVTLDPARDTAALMADYVRPLGHGFVTVTGPVDAIDRLAARHRIVAVRNLPSGGEYSVDHSSEVLLIGPDGAEIERFPYAMDYREVARRLAAHLAAAPAG